MVEQRGRVLLDNQNKCKQQTQNRKRGITQNSAKTHTM